jgi:hypothetical protein
MRGFTIYWFFKIKPKFMNFYMNAVVTCRMILKLCYHLCLLDDAHLSYWEVAQEVIKNELIRLGNTLIYLIHVLMTVAARSKAWTVFARSNAGIVGLNPTRGMDVYVCLFSACVVLCIKGLIPRSRSHTDCAWLKKLKKAVKVHKGFRAIDIKI